MNLITRRTFMKTTALTIGAVALLSQGRALADGGGGSSSSVSWKMWCSEPSLEDSIRYVVEGPFVIPKIGGGNATLDVSVRLETKAADNPSWVDPYNFIEFSQLGEVRAQVIGGTEDYSPYYCDFQVLCDQDTGETTASFEENMSEWRYVATLGDGTTVHVVMAPVDSPRVFHDTPSLKSPIRCATGLQVTVGYIPPNQPQVTLMDKVYAISSVFVSFLTSP
ncbi:MAG: twin-arginine translocation signal domain-containing protein [Verrucomicrobiota bacterium]